MVAGWPGMVVVTVFVITTVLCAVSLSVRSTSHGPRLAAAEANHVVMSVAMILMAEPATMSVVPPAVGAWIFGAAGAGWLALLVTLRWREEPLGPAVGLDRCAAHPTHLLLVNAAMAAMYVAMMPAGGDSSMGDMPGMDMSRSGPSPALVAVLAVLALYLLAHAVATVVVIARRRGGVATAGDTACPTTGDPACPTTGARATTGAPETAAPTPTTGSLATLARPVHALAHGVPQLIGQAGMSVAMAAMLLLMV
ncbi:DUF5134 domain-containing protein [Actinomycetospora endophytica]|uniref:DUF5134 domain-containing protein n=1 Tax=Actinomycetospora endophytica TaxID=2291215 RepID=A0ABS8PDJ0_9PSEU|nr:DUF5134 domain-containing protein [Actinomycetospora endophytica]MCD2196343.1 DUF5134 domain-containing protein [Actinomycetospora endophytica]